MATLGLKPEVSVPVALATGGLVYGIFQMNLPNLTDVRAAPPKDGDVDASERLATWTAAAVVAGVSLIARDPNVFIVGGAMVVALAWHYRHANHVDPQTGKAGFMHNSRVAPAADMTETSSPDYASDYAMG